MIDMYSIKSPLRYPGGKSRAIDLIFRHMPKTFSEFREPFVGGGSVFIQVRQRLPNAKVWINDLNYDLYCFWAVLQKDADSLIKKVRVVKDTELNGNDLFCRYRDSLTDNISEFDRAVRFFVLNRITFSGTVDSGGYSQGAFDGRFTHSSIDRLAPVAPLLKGVRITNLDYKELLDAEGEQVCIFLDPPYYSATKSRLYGKNGNLHMTFDHSVFAAKMKECQHSWEITYDDSQIIRDNFSFANIYEWELQYGMNNYMQGKAAKGRELFITNYCASGT